MKTVIKKIIRNLMIFLIIFLLLPALIIPYYKKQIYTDLEKVKPASVAIVFGAAVSPKGPSDILKDRLDTAAILYIQKKVNKILVSGDNRKSDYDEPGVMAYYLQRTYAIPAEDILQDPYGLRTYDTCRRAKEIYGVQNAILVTQGYHLIRALFTCNWTGLSSTGISATRQNYLLEQRFKVREVLAIYKSIIDVFIYEPNWIES